MIDQRQVSNQLCGVSPRTDSTKPSEVKQRRTKRSLAATIVLPPDGKRYYLKPMSLKVEEYGENKGGGLRWLGHTCLHGSVSASK